MPPDFLLPDCGSASMTAIPALPPSFRAAACLLLCMASAVAVTAQDPAIPVLVVGGQNNHDWKTGNAFLMALLQRPGFAPVESDTPEKGAPKQAWAQWKP